MAKSGLYGIILELGCKYLPNIAYYSTTRALVSSLLMLGKARLTAGALLYSTGFGVVDVPRFSSWSQDFWTSLYVKFFHIHNEAAC